jgi:hypothetical protein
MKWELDDSYFGRRLAILGARKRECKAVQQFLSALGDRTITSKCYLEEKVATDSRLLTFATLDSVIDRLELPVPLTLNYYKFENIHRRLSLDVLLNLENAQSPLLDPIGSMHDYDCPHGAVFKWPYKGYYVLHNWKPRIEDNSSKVVYKVASGIQVIIEPWLALVDAIVRVVNR